MIDQDKLQAATEMFLEGLGIDWKVDEHSKDTPARVARAWKDDFGAGYEQKVADILTVTFSEDYDQMIVVKDIPFMSFCSHHIVPFVGKAKIGYVPKAGNITGLSKLSRVLHVYARRLQIQERLTRQVAEAMQEILKPEGVAVLLDAEHMCMSQRGVKSPGSSTVTSYLLGCFRDQPEARAEFMSL